MLFLGDKKRKNWVKVVRLRTAQVRICDCKAPKNCSYQVAGTGLGKYRAVEVRRKPRLTQFRQGTRHRVRQASGLGKQKAKKDFAFVVLKPTQGSRFFFSVPKPARTAKKTCFSHTALDRRQESSPRRAQIMTKLGRCMLY